jgi:hypothetical protein
MLSAWPVWAGQVSLRAETPTGGESTGTFAQTSVNTITQTTTDTFVATYAHTQISTTVSTNGTVTQTVISTSIDTVTSTSISTLISTSVDTITSGGARALPRAAQKCMNEINKSFARVAKAQCKEMRDCIKLGSANRLGSQSIEECLSADYKTKVAQARARTLDVSSDTCGGMLDFGPTDPNAVNRAAVSAGVSLAHGVFGEDLHAAILPSTDRRGSKCQRSVAKAVVKCLEAKLDEFNRCKKRGLDGSAMLPEANLPFTDPNDIALCMGHDPRGKIARACDPQGGGIRKAIGTRCFASNLAAAFPGCGTSELGELAECLDEIVECRACRALNEADGLARDCDELDDGQLNGSCP